MAGEDPTTQDPGQQEPGQEPAQQTEPQGDGKPEPDWKAQARKWEDRAKANAAAAKKLADLEAANQTAQEKAEAAAKAAEDRAVAALRRACSSELRSLLTEAGIPNAAGIVEDLDISRFTGDDGAVDPARATALVEKYKPFIPPSGPRAPAPNPAQGATAQPRSLAEMVAEADRQRATSGSAKDAKTSMVLKSRLLMQARAAQQQR